MCQAFNLHTLSVSVSIFQMRTFICFHPNTQPLWQFYYINVNCFGNHGKEVWAYKERKLDHAVYSGEEALGAQWLKGGVWRESPAKCWLVEIRRQKWSQTSSCSFNLLLLQSSLTASCLFLKYPKLILKIDTLQMLAWLIHLPKLIKAAKLEVLQAIQSLNLE